MTLLQAAAGGILPPEYAGLITGPITNEALAFNASLATVVTTGSASFNIPILKEDAGAAWVVEGGEIAADDPTLDELTVTPKKVAGLTIISRELADDSSENAQELVGQGLARSIINQINAAFLGNLAAPAPKGLTSLANVTAVAGNLANLDVFAEAIAEAENAGANLTGWVVHPDDALTIAKLKDLATSNKVLLENSRIIMGRPVIVSTKATVGTIWGLAAGRNITVLRDDVELAVSDDAYFSSDRIAIRATLRIGFGFPAEDSIIKMDVTGA